MGVRRAIDDEGVRVEHEGMAGAGTGDDAVDQALSVLDGLAERPVREHVGVFEAVHAALADRLAEGP